MRLDLPPRVLPSALRRLGQGSLTLGLVLALAGASPLLGLTWGATAGPPWLAVACLVLALLPLAFACMILFGRSSIEVVGKRLVIRERAGLLCLRRSFALGTITQMQVEALPLSASIHGASSEGGGASIIVLVADTVDRGRRVLLFGYTPAILEDLAARLMQLKATDAQ